MQSPNTSSPQFLFSQSHFAAPVIQTINNDSSSVTFNFGGAKVDPLEATHIQIRKQARLAEETGSWLLADTADSPSATAFRDFRDDFTLENNTLLFSGYPLVGKTVLATAVKQHLTDLRSSLPSSSVSAVSALYLGADDIKELSYHEVRLRLLNNVVWQCRGSGHYHSEFDLVGAATSEQESMAPRVVDACFAQICEALEAFYIVVDGLDEYPYGERQLLMQFLKDLQSTQGAKIKVFATFRFLQEIADFFHGSKSLQLQAHDEDIALFVRDRILKSPRLHEWAKATCDLKKCRGRTMMCGSEETACRVYKMLHAVLRASGQLSVQTTAASTHYADQSRFFIAKHHMKVLADQQTQRDIDRTIDELPHLTPSDIYRDEVNKIRALNDTDKKLGLEILMWVFYSGQRPLTLGALRYALALKRDATEPPSMDTDDAFLNPDEIGRLTRDLVVVNKATHTVSGFHRTVYSYFSSVQWLDFPHAADLIISRSARHLSFNNGAFFRSDTEFLSHLFTKVAMAEIQHQIDVVESNPTFGICDGQATVKVEMQPDLKNISSTFYSLGGANSSRSTLVYTTRLALSRKVLSQLLDMTKDVSVRKFHFSHAPEVHRLYSTEQRYQPLATMIETPLHFAAVLRCKLLTEMVLNDRDPPPVDSVNHHGDTALTIAMKLGCERVLTVLLQNHASFDLRIPSGWDVLLHAIAQDHGGIAQQTLQEAAERAKQKSRFSKKASGVHLLQCVYNGLADLSSALKRCKKHPNLAKLLGTALLIAVDRQHDHIIDQLLTRIDNNEVNVNFSDRVGNTALHRAAQRNNESMVTHLLDKGANVNFKNKSGLTPWHSISHLPTHRLVSQRLIQGGADPDTRGKDGVSHLYTSAAGGHVVSMRVMLEAGTNPDIRTNFGWSPLHWAAGNGHLEATRLLLEWDKHPRGKKADVNCLSDTAETPLDRALVWKHTAVIELLKEHGALTGREVHGLPGRRSVLERFYSYSEPTILRDDDDYDDYFYHLFGTHFGSSMTEQELERTFGRQARRRPLWKRLFTPSPRSSPHSFLTPSLPTLSRPESSDASARDFSSASEEGEEEDAS